jgi:hypothetical protein
MIVVVYGDRMETALSTSAYAPTNRLLDKERTTNISYLYVITGVTLKTHILDFKC